ncbi:MAG: hypothetical protein IJQ11_02720 [Bacteroidales bacterium]|nr:hypothetical protein [Bacteroidales bacterium]
MKTKYLNLFVGFIALAVMVASCRKEPKPDDKSKIDIKGSLSNGDMRSPNIVANYLEKTVWLKFYDNLGACTVNISNSGGYVAVCDTVDTYYGATYSYYMGDQPLSRYHLVISNGTDSTEGWFNNFKIVAVRPKQ